MLSGHPSSSLVFGFLASWLFWKLRFNSCGFSLVYVAFGGFGFSHRLLSQFLSGGFLALHPFIGFWLWLPASVLETVLVFVCMYVRNLCHLCMYLCMSVCMRFFKHQREGCRPNPRAAFYILTHAFLNHRFSGHPGRAAATPNPQNCTPNSIITFSTIICSLLYRCFTEV